MPLSENSSTGLQKIKSIDDEISLYFRSVSKKQWPMIEMHWQKQKAAKANLDNKLRLLLTEDELRMLNIQK